MEKRAFHLARAAIRARKLDFSVDGYPGAMDENPSESTESDSADTPASGFPEPPGEDPGKVDPDRDPHHQLNNPVEDPDPTEWPDPYDKREDPRDPPNPDGKPAGDEPHPIVGSQSTSAPHPSKDPEAGDRWEGPKRDKLDD